MFSRMKYPVSQATNASVCIQDWVSERVYPGSVFCLQGTHTHQEEPMLATVIQSVLPPTLNK